MALDSTTNATELTAEQVSTLLVKPLEQAAQFLAAGPQIFDTAGPLRIPKLGAAVDGEWYAQNEQIIDTDPEFDEVELLPSTMKSVKTLTRYSNELARQSVIALDAALQDRLVTGVANKLDAQFFSASGDGITTPQGLFAWTGTQSVAVDGAINLDALLDAEAKALAVNANVQAMRWVMTPREFTSIRKLKGADERYLVQPDATAAGGFVLFGHSVIVTNRVPDTTGSPATGRAALVDFSQIAVARDQAPSVKILDQTFGDFDQQAVRVTARYDAKPLNAEAVVKLTGITVA